MLVVLGLHAVHLRRELILELLLHLRLRPLRLRVQGGGSGTCSAFSESLFTAALRMVTHTTSTQSTHRSLKSWGMIGEKVSMCTKGQNFHPALIAFHHVALNLLL